MRKALAVLSLLVGFIASARANDTIEIDAGVLHNATGTALVPQGGLLELIASPVTVNTPDGVFTAPTSTSFITGGDILVASFAMNYDFAQGETDNIVNFPISAAGIATGDALLLRWFPTLTLASTAPGVGATYGQFRSDSAESEGGIPWFVPADSQVLSFPNGLNFNTAAAGGTHLEPTGYASNVVVLAGVPEPSSYSFFAGALAIFISLRTRSERGKASTLSDTVSQS